MASSTSPGEGREDQLTLEACHKSFGGYQKVYSHLSVETGCRMRFGVYIPPQADTRRVPVIYYLSGLTSTEDNFITKSGVQRVAGECGVMVVNPDTSPRGCHIPGEDEHPDLGTGAGMYVDATRGQWARNYRMYSYVTRELTRIVDDNLPVIPGRRAICGHSMGGHGAMICYLKNPGLYQSVSALAPICNPSAHERSARTYREYFGEDVSKWKEYDTTELVKNYTGPPVHILIDQGTSDEYLTLGHLLPSKLVAACTDTPVSLTLRLHQGYDHKYYFVATFIEDHIKYHVKALNAVKQ